MFGLRNGHQPKSNSEKIAPPPKGSGVKLVDLPRFCFRCGCSEHYRDFPNKESMTCTRCLELGELDRERRNAGAEEERVHQKFRDKLDLLDRLIRLKEIRFDVGSLGGTRENFDYDADIKLLVESLMQNACIGVDTAGDYGETVDIP